MKRVLVDVDMLTKVIGGNHHDRSERGMVRIGQKFCMICGSSFEAKIAIREQIAAASDEPDPVRELEEFLDKHRDADVSSIHHDIVARFRRAFGDQ